MGGPVAEEIILCSLKVLYGVLYCESARLCFLRRTHARTILFCPVLGDFCDDDDDDDDATSAAKNTNGHSRINTLYKSLLYYTI